MLQDNSDKEDLPQGISLYDIRELIGRGGMGSVYRAYDPRLDREVALKTIRSDRLKSERWKRKFLHEARLTCRLNHPSIIPIYSIRADAKYLYYTMPFVEGVNLREIFTQTVEGGHKVGDSILSLCRHFVTICQAVSYSHAQEVLHLDLKPQNIMLGEYDEVVILDWGIARHMDELADFDKEFEIQDSLPQKPKHAGTLPYLLPRTFFGEAPSEATDIFALGVILYEMLALEQPFHRKECKKAYLEALQSTQDPSTFVELYAHLLYQSIPPPSQVAPYRDVPPHLELIAMRCLSPRPEQEFDSVKDLLEEVKGYLEGRPQWVPVSHIHTNRPSDWEFQELIQVNRQVSFTRTPGNTEWVHLMVSKNSFAEDTRLEMRLKIQEGCKGIGLLLSIPEPSQRNGPTDGFCLWISAEDDVPGTLYRYNIDVLHVEHPSLPKDRWIDIRFERLNYAVSLFINGVMALSYINHLPLMGTRVGFFTKDDLFECSPIQVSVASLSLRVSCLAVPRALMAAGLLSEARSEYHRIGFSFPGRQESREAMFMAGLTLVEQAKQAPSGQKEPLFQEALDEFSALSSTPGAPLEYFGLSRDEVRRDLQSVYDEYGLK